MLERLTAGLQTVKNAARTALGLTTVGLYTAICGLYLLVLAPLRPKSPQIVPIMRGWGFVFAKAAGLTVTVEGAELLDPEASYVIVSNHLSNLDPAIHIAFMPVGVSFLAKKELFRIPIMGPAMRAIGIVETDREAHAAAHRSINVGVARAVALNRSLVIYPEGHRSRNGDLREFKKGAFRIAVDNGLPVVPASLTGTWSAWPPGAKTMRGGQAHVVLHPPIPTDGIDRNHLDELRDRAHAAVASRLEPVAPPAGTAPDQV